MIWIPPWLYDLLEELGALSSTASVGPYPTTMAVGEEDDGFFG